MRGEVHEIILLHKRLYHAGAQLLSLKESLSDHLESLREEEKFKEDLVIHDWGELISEGTYRDQIRIIAKMEVLAERIHLAAELFIVKPDKKLYEGLYDGQARFFNID